MTQNASSPNPAVDTQIEPTVPVSVPVSPAEARPVPLGRLVGVDLARGLAVFGMYAAHVGPDPSDGGVRAR